MNKFFSKALKLSTLSAEEVLFRLKSMYTTKKEALLFRCGYRLKYREINTVDESPGRFFLSGCDRKKKIEQLRSLGYMDRIIQEAEQILSGKVNLLGVEMVVPSGKNWSRDPVTGKMWPFLFYTRVRFHPSVKNLDIKFVWEINRHQYLIPLGKAFWVTKDEKYAQAVFEIIADWIAENPYHTGVNWTSPLENAVRLFSWIWALTFCKDSAYYKEQFQPVKKSIFEQTHHIHNHLSIYSSPYNHLVGEASALYLVGTLFPEFHKAAVWRKTGWDILKNSIETQFHPDGITVEQAFFYHHFTLGFYLTCLLVQKTNQGQIPEPLLNRIEKAIEISVYIEMPDGTYPMKGDIDNARSIYFSLEHAWDFSLFHYLGAFFFNRPDFIIQKDIIPEEIFWLLDDAALSSVTEMTSAVPASPVKIFTQSGYCIVRDSWDKTSNYLCFDFGEIAHGLSQEAVPSAAHGHADALSFELCALGKPFLIDAGFNTYFGDLKWHKYFRTEHAHNTFTVNGHAQAEYCGRLKWQKIGLPELVSWKDDSRFTECSARIVYSPNVTAYRKVYYQKTGFWLFHDTIASNHNLEINTFFNFHPDVSIDICNQTSEITARNESACILIKFLNKQVIYDVSQDKDVPAGWVCEGYGMKEKASAVVVKWPNEDPCHGFFFIIVPFLITDTPPRIEWNPETYDGKIQTDSSLYRFLIQDQKNITVTKVENGIPENT